MANQMLFKNVTSNILFNMASFDSIREFSKQFGDYPFDKDIEFIFFYNMTLPVNITYNEIIPLQKQLSALLNIADNGGLMKENVNTSIFYAKNMLDLYYFNQTGDLITVFNRFKLTSKETLGFLCDYFFKYNLKHFTLLSFNDNGTLYEGTSQERAFSLLFPIMVKNSIDKIKENVKLILLSKVIFSYFVSEIKKDCVYFVSKITADSRLQAICSNNNTDMKSYRSVKNWVLPFFDILEFENLKKNLNFTDDEMKQFYNSTNFGYYINFAENVVSNQYNCEGNCDPEYLAMLQWGQSMITLDPPNVFKNESSTSLSHWDELLYPSKIIN